MSNFKKKLLSFFKGMKAVTGVSGILTAYAAYRAMSASHFSIWIWISALFFITTGVLLYLLLKTPSESDSSTMPSSTDPQINQKMIEMGKNANIKDSVIRDNLMLATRSGSRDTKLNPPTRLLSRDEKETLINKGEVLSKELMDFSAQQRLEEPQFSFASPSASEEERTRHWNAQNTEQEIFRNKTQSLYESNFVNRIAEFLDEVQDIGFEVDQQLLILYPRLAGPTPIQDTARGIAIIVGRIRRMP